MAIMRQSPYSLNLYFSGESLIDNDLNKKIIQFQVMIHDIKKKEKRVIKNLKCIRGGYFR